MAAFAITLAAPLPIAGVTIAQTPVADAQLDALFWESVARSDDRAQFAAYLARFPNGVFAELARLKIAAIDRRGGTASPAPLPTPTPTPPPAAAPPVTTPTAVAPPALAADLSTMSNADLLAGAFGQARKPYTSADAVTQAVPVAPVLPPVPPLVFPPRFCSAEARNAFYETTYKAAKTVGDENNRRTIEHSRAIQTVYDRYAAERDEPAMTTVARAATAYQPIAAQAYRESSDLAGRYDELMRVPIEKCD